MTKTAKLFRNGNSQAVRLPREFRFKGDEVRIRKVGDTVVLEPIIPDVKAWLAEYDAIHSPRTLWLKDVISLRRRSGSCLNKYLLDTGICIALLRDASNLVARRFQRTISRRESIYISSLVLCELWYGAYKSSRVRNIERCGDSFLVLSKFCDSMRRMLTPPVKLGYAGTDGNDDRLVWHAHRGSMLEQGF